MQIRHHEPLSGWHTLQASAQAQSLYVIEQADELAALPTDVFMLGSGSNVIFCGEVARPLAHLQLKGRQVIAEDEQFIYYRAEAGELWHDVVKETSEHGWYGLENLALIPGTVGAAPVQNIGAYGCEVGEVIDCVHVYDRHDDSHHKLSAAACNFAYRHSQFKEGWRDRYIIIAVTFRLARHGELQLNYPDLAQYKRPLTNPAQVCEAVSTIRQNKLPDPRELPNAGSFFHNPVIRENELKALQKQYPDLPAFAAHAGFVKVSAAWCIEQCGFKGQSQNGVGMYHKHALVLVNQGGSGQDILRYAANVQRAVHERFALTLNIEPTIVGERYA
ncbi:UDP-N-acetylmuramate dehydrogenase [Suttonella sp. R2A3]|uniref:UDP-N-acetylmuramate dehydrogenase n=1 Tax=Suttonella sp. R2A3 TaxID=2908648 RepID=UPI001F1A4746|nr:UDP-N-acetylmuramate dehydrogenase [Suttonella sp. R2A3]UJF24857.1 UDP-N-acetylmuramate dehydrogenase [Suttonella sp. R2A3]